MNPKSFALNPTLLSTSSSTNNLALFQSLGNAIVGKGTTAGVTYGLPDDGTIGYTVAGGEIYPGKSSNAHLRDYFILFQQPSDLLKYF